MKSIDLVKFAEYSEKLPADWLTPVMSKKSVFSTLNILSSHVVDFALVFSVTSVMAIAFNHFMKMILITKGLKLAYSQEFVLGLSAPAFPLMLFSYFFLSYFLNHGQTYGMYLLKKRIEMKELNYKDSFKSAIHSMILSFSCGLSYSFQKNTWMSFKGHDYLYQDLITFKDVAPTELMQLIENDMSKPQENMNWPKAA